MLNGNGYILITSPEYGAVANYAYHLDSAKFAIFLKEHCINKLGIKHIIDDVTAINNHDNGDIASVTTAKNADIVADLFIDCTGTRSLLLGQHYKVPFIKVDETLFCDQTLALQVPYDNDDSEIASHTLSTAQDAGWIWDIGLPTRRGIGYVYSHNHQTEDQAISRLEQYVGKKFSECTLKKIPIDAGRHKVLWKKNCVAVGLSSGFLEPLEASSLLLVEMSAQMLADQLPTNRKTMNIVAKRFNEAFSYRWQRIIDFLKLHYLLSKREEPFWQDNRQASSVPESLQELMALWQHRSPADFDFTNNNEVFPAASYQYILYGMGFKTDYQHKITSLAQTQLAQQQFERKKKMTQQAIGLLPKNRELINTQVSEFTFSQ
ncbi:MAG: tryptophan 7-halogenase [Colwellia sp.]|nr:tryptophan 7-halogenase [Colwellia sp.]